MNENERIDYQQAMADAGDYERRIVRLARLAASIKHDPRRLPQLFALADGELKHLERRNDG